MKKKIIMTLLASTLIVGSMTGCGSTKLTKSSITIELGNEDAIKVSDFMDLSKDELKSAKLNTKDVNFFKEGNYKANDGKKTFTSSFGETIRTNPNNYKYDTKYAAEFYPKGFWANGECLTMDELSDARQGKNEAAARYMLAGGDASMSQERFDQKYLSDEDFYAKYGWHLSKYQQ